ncbi:MAG: 50S ribosomal protein L25/general stress protein Ctc [Actinobacteria bacterium]|jgi:large subunit ribosomal protein L25|nr:50S ribosomal protein L25/general stress protein Ctc [Candidatus Planktophila sp.]NQW74830.1 50S ribosomal protein L25/general stress protein Ctc [Candidatus Planktophila sp.]PHX66928.1 MAG: 50S ribosomal protein L25/general stress protein Ctc [Actinomycetota bacterium]
MAEITINGVVRTEFGKGASRRARRDGLVPAVIYGHGEKPQHITLPARELGVALKQSNVLLDIVIDGKTELTLPKAIVRHPLKQILEHVDLVLVRRGEKVVVSVPVHATGEYDRDGILEHVNNTIDVLVEATAIPSFLELDITGLAAGLSLYAGDVVLPAGVVLESDPKMIVVHISERSTIVEEVAPVVVAADASAEAPAADAEKKDS